MRMMKIVADSSANVRKTANAAFASAPLKVITSGKEFVDNDQLDVKDMVEYFDHYKGKSQTSCPNSSDWLEAFGDADDIFCVTITSALSGSYNAACVAKQMLESEYPNKRVFVIDSLSAGPEMQLIVDQIDEWIAQGCSYEQICRAVDDYTKQTGLLFVLESLKNFAANGRVSPVVAKVVGILGIRVVGRASQRGELEPLHKCRGESKSLDAVVSCLKEAGVSGGRVLIAHCENEVAALHLKSRIGERLPNARVEISACGGLCSYYAEKGGLLIGFEKM